MSYLNQIIYFLVHVIYAKYKKTILLFKQLRHCKPIPFPNSLRSILNYLLTETEKNLQNFYSKHDKLK